MEALAQLWDDLPAAAGLTVPPGLAALCVLLAARLRRSADRPRAELAGASLGLGLAALTLVLAALSVPTFLVEGYWPVHCRLGVDLHALRQDVALEAREYVAVSLALAAATALLALRPLRYAARVRRSPGHRLRPMALACLELAGIALLAGAALLVLSLLPPAA